MLSGKEHSGDRLTFRGTSLVYWVKSSLMFLPTQHLETMVTALYLFIPFKGIVKNSYSFGRIIYIKSRIRSHPSLRNDDFHYFF